MHLETIKNQEANEKISCGYRNYMTLVFSQIFLSLVYSASLGKDVFITLPLFPQCILSLGDQE